MKADFESVDEYVAAQPEAVRRTLRRIRSAIRKAVPGGDYVISYKIPAYKLHGEPVLYFAAWKEHYSLYPATKRVIAAFMDKLAEYDVKKGTIRFPLFQPVPVNLIGRIAEFRAKEVVDGEKARPARAKAKTASKKM